QVNVDDPMPQVVVAAGVERVRARKARAVHKHIDRAESIYDGSNGAAYRIRVCHVAGELDVRTAVGEVLERTRAGRHSPAQGLEPVDDCNADSARPAGDEHRFHCAVNPPSIGITVPVMNDDASDARNATTHAISWGAANRRS